MLWYYSKVTKKSFKFKNAVSVVWFKSGLRDPIKKNQNVNLFHRGGQPKVTLKKGNVNRENRLKNWFLSFTDGFFKVLRA